MSSSRSTAIARAVTFPTWRRSCSFAPSRPPLGRSSRRRDRVLRVPASPRSKKMGLKSAPVLTVALAVVGAVCLWFGLWPLAALALAFLVGGRREPVTVAADAIVFVSLAGHADPLWVALLLAATLVA